MQSIRHRGKVQEAASIRIKVCSSSRKGQEDGSKEEGRSISGGDLIRLRPGIEETLDGSSGLETPYHLEIRHCHCHVASTNGKTSIGIGTGECRDGDARAAGLEQSRETAPVDVTGVERQTKTG